MLNYYIKADGTVYGTNGDPQPGEYLAPSLPEVPGSKWQVVSESSSALGIIYTWGWVPPAPTPSWVGLLDWAATNVAEAELWALQTSMYGSFMNTAAMTGNWGTPDGSTGGAAGYYAKLKADIAATPTKYSPATSATLTTIAGQFTTFAIPITP